MNQLIAALALAFVTGGGLQLTIGKILDRKNSDRDTWFRESKTAYNRVRNECTSCKSELHSMSSAFFELLEDLEDQIVPVIGLPEADPAQIRAALRTCIRKARKTAVDVDYSRPVDD